MNDLINSMFELFGAPFILLNCYRVYQDKSVAGVSIIATAYFVAFGAWNIYYYPSLGQMLSFYAGVALLSANALYVSLLIWYGVINKNKLAVAHG